MEFIDDKLVLSNPISEKNIKEMRLNMNDEDQIAFDKFLERNWGIKPPKVVKYADGGEEIKVLSGGKKPQSKATEDFTNNFVKSLDIEEDTTEDVDKTDDNKEKTEPKAEEEKKEKTPRRIIRNILSKPAGNMDSIVKKDDEPEIRNELLGGLFDTDDDDSNDENDDE